MPPRGGPIRWRVHCTSSPDAVFRLLATPAGRARFWAATADESGGVIAFRFADGTSVDSPIVRCEPPSLFEIGYFGGSRATFELEDDGSGGTVVTLTERGVPDAALDDNRAGWVSVLLSLKAAADFGVDLRNGDPGRGWGEGFVDP